MNRLISIVHGVASGPDQNWFREVEHQAKEWGYDSIVSDYPSNATDQPPHYPAVEDFAEWDKVFEAESGKVLYRIDALIGHSLGGAFVLRKLEQDTRRRYKLVCTVSSTIGAREINGYDGNIDSFIRQGRFDWSTIRARSEHFIHFHGSDDPYINPEEAEVLAQGTGGKIVMVPEGKHLNADAGYTSFERLVEEIQPILNEE